MAPKQVKDDSARRTAGTLLNQYIERRRHEGAANERIRMELSELPGLFYLGYETSNELVNLVKELSRLGLSQTELLVQIDETIRRTEHGKNHQA
jgi:hypothetical protein